MSATILCYHKVGPVEEEGRKLNIEPSRLASHVALFSRRRGPILLARDLAGSWPREFVCFTFDDAYKSTMTFAPEILERYGVRGSFYVVASKVGETSDWEGPAARPLASWDLLARAQDHGHEIGNHTLRHLPMKTLAFADQVSAVASADTLLRSRGILPTSFCYPYGSLNEDAMRAVAQAGYAVGLALGKRLASPRESRLAVARIAVAFSDSLPKLLYRLYVRPRLRLRPVR